MNGNAISHFHPLDQFVNPDMNCLGFQISIEYPSIECFEKDYDFPGNDVKSIPNIKSAEECQSLCQASDSGCTFFVYSYQHTQNDMTKDQCWLKFNNENRTPLKGFISGPKDCEELLPQITFKYLSLDCKNLQNQIPICEKSSLVTLSEDEENELFGMFNIN